MLVILAIDPASQHCSGEDLPLIIIRLRDEDWEAHIVQFDIAPRDVLCETLPTNPRLEPRSVYRVDDRDIIEPNIAQIREQPLILAKRANGQSVRIVAHGAAVDLDVVRTRLDSECIIAVVDHEVGDVHVFAPGCQSRRC